MELGKFESLMDEYHDALDNYTNRISDVLKAIDDIKSSADLVLEMFEDFFKEPEFSDRQAGEVYKHRELFMNQMSLFLDFEKKIEPIIDMLQNKGSLYLLAPSLRKRNK